MGIFIRQGIKGSMVSYIGAVVGYFNVVFITPYCLPPDIVGLNRVIVDMGIYLAFLAQLGILPGIIRFYPKFKNNENQLLFLSFIIPMIGFILFSIIFYAVRGVIISYFSENSPLINHYISLILPLTFFIVYLGVLETYSSCLLRIVVPKVIREVILKFLNIVIIILFYFKFLNLYQFLWGIVIIYAIASLLNLIYLTILTRIKLGTVTDLLHFDRTIIKEFMSYILLILLLGIGSNVVNKIDVFMISSYINLTNTGIYSIAFYITVIMEIPARSFQQLAGPVIAKSFHENDNQSLKEIYTKSSLIQFLVGGILFLIVWINIDSIFSVMPNGSTYKAGKYVILFLGFSKLFDMVTGVNSLILSNSKNYASLLIFISYLTLITIVTNYLLIPGYGITGAAIASLIALASYNIILIFYLWVKMRLQPFSRSTALTIGLIVALFLLDFLIPKFPDPWVDIFIRTLAIGSLSVFAVYKLHISEDINELISTTLSYLKIWK